MTGEILTLGQVRIHAGAATRLEAQREAADILEAAGAVTGAYYDAMLAREATVSTYMGNELAIPHGTNEAKSEILASALSVVRYDGGVDWDGEPVTFVIGIAGRGERTRLSAGHRRGHLLVLDRRPRGAGAGVVCAQRLLPNAAAPPPRQVRCG